MPQDDRGRYFMSNEKIPQRMYYEVEEWVKVREWPERRTVLDESDLPYMDFAVFKITPEDNKLRPTYETVWGPMENWEFIEGILSYDYGEEGSRIYPGAASAAA